MSILKKSLFIFFIVSHLEVLGWPILVGCTRSASNSDPSQEAAVGKNLMAPNKVSNQVVNLAIWGNYLTDQIIHDFESSTSIKIQVTNYSSNEELLAKVQMGGSGIDVAVPSDYMVQILKNLSLLENLDPTLIPNQALIDKTYLRQNFDPENKYSLPYAWSTAGIVINKSLFKGTIRSWKDFYESPQLKGKLSVLDDAREVTGSVLKMYGYSVNSTRLDELKKAKDFLIGIKSRVKLFTSFPVDSLLNREIIAAQAYSTDANQAAARSQDKLEYILPTEGSTLALDNLVIIKGSKNKMQAHKLIDFLLSEKSNLNFVTHILAGPVLIKTKSNLPDNLKKNPALFPDEKAFKSLEFIQDLGEKNRLYEDIWTEVKTL